MHGGRPGGLRFLFRVAGRFAAHPTNSTPPHGPATPAPTLAPRLRTLWAVNYVVQITEQTTYNIKTPELSLWLQSKTHTHANLEAAHRTTDRNDLATKAYTHEKSRAKNSTLTPRPMYEAWKHSSRNILCYPFMVVRPICVDAHIMKTTYKTHFKISKYS
jgi:hypothetical protein